MKFIIYAECSFFFFRVVAIYELALVAIALTN